MPRTFGPVILAVILATGCGGDGNGDSASQPSTVTVTTNPTEGTISKQEFIRQADAICVSYAAQAKKLEQQSYAQSFSEVTHVAEQLESLVRSAATKLNSLPQPNDPAGANEFISILNQLEGEYRNLGQAGEDHNIRRVRTEINDIGQLFARAQGVAVAYGFTGCNLGPS